MFDFWTFNNLWPVCSYLFHSTVFFFLWSSDWNFTECPLHVCDGSHSLSSSFKDRIFLGNLCGSARILKSTLDRGDHPHDSLAKHRSIVSSPRNHQFEMKPLGFEWDTTASTNNACDFATCNESTVFPWIQLNHQIKGLASPNPILPSSQPLHHLLPAMILVPPRRNDLMHLLP